MLLGELGVWSAELRYGDRAEALEAAAELEELGYGAIWVPGGAGGPVFDDAGALLAATREIAVATGILNVWMHEPEETRAGHHRLTRAHPGRFLLGLGVSHAMLVEATSRRYERPLRVMSSYLDALDSSPAPVPRNERALAALGPRMLGIARDRALGAHPYLVTPEHSAVAREVLGEGPLLAPEQPVVRESDPSRARDAARRHLELYLKLPNYTNNLRRLGFTEEDLSGGGSDHLVDAVVCWGSDETIRRRVDAHRDAGADHVCIQVLGGSQGGMPREDWRALAPGPARR